MKEKIETERRGCKKIFLIVDSEAPNILLLTGLEIRPVKEPGK